VKNRFRDLITFFGTVKRLKGLKREDTRAEYAFRGWWTYLFLHPLSPHARRRGHRLAVIDRVEPVISV